MKTRRKSTARRKPRRSSNPKSSSLRHRSAAAHLRRHSQRARRRNPARSTGLVAKGISLAAGAALVQFTLGFIPPIGGVSPLADAARTAGAGWLLGTAMDKTGLLKEYASDVMLAGFTLAGGKLISSFILPFANRIFTPARPTQPSQQQAATGVQGIAQLYPGLQPFSAYGSSRGLNGIAVIDPGMQPFGEYA